MALLPLTVGLRRTRAPEPVSRLSLRWGDHGDRALVGAGLVALGAALVAQTTVFTLALGLLGSALHATGWLVQPGRPRTRVVVAVVGTTACWCALGGAQALWPLAALLPCWLAVRRRPAATALLTSVPLAASVAVGSALPYVADKPVVLAVTLGAVLIAARAARELTLRVRVRLTHGKPIGSRARAGGPAPVD